MSELLSKVAEILKAPEELVQRSAEARAEASGKSVDEVLNSWAGGESIEASAPVEEKPVEEAPVEEAPVEESPVEESPVEEAPVEEAPVEEVVQEVIEELVDLKNESSLAFISGVLSIAVFTFVFAFLIPKNQSTSIVESSLNNTISVSADVVKGAEGLFSAGFCCGSRADLSRYLLLSGWIQLPVHDPAQQGLHHRTVLAGGRGLDLGHALFQP